MPAALCFAYPARFFHSRLFNTDLLAHFGFFSLFPPCSACYCWYCCCCCCRCLRRRRRPRRLILLEHNFNFCYVANTTEHSHTFPFFLLRSFAVPHTASTLYYLFDLLANPSIGSMSRPPVLDSMGHWHSTSGRILDVFSTDRHLCGHFLNTLPRTHLIRLDSRSYLHAGANWVYPPRRCFSFFVTAADTTCLGLLVSYIQHVPTACFVASSTVSSYCSYSSS